MKLLFENWRGFLTEEKVPTVNTDVVQNAHEKFVQEAGQDGLNAAKKNKKE